MTKIEKYTQEAIAIASDNTHGYSQTSRWGSPDYDCSSMVITVVQNSGIPVKTGGATYTGNMRGVFLSCGFKDVTASCNLATADGMVRGDILLNDVNHTAIYIGNRQIVHARSSEGNSTAGDQSGNEIRTQAYWNFPWNVILRYGSDEEYNGNAGSDISEIAAGTIVSGTTSVTPDVNGNNKNYPNIIVTGDCGEEVRTLQKMLIAIGYSCGDCGADGEFGNGTLSALIAYQRQKGLETDGEYGPQTRASLEGNYKAFTGGSAPCASADSDDENDEETIWFYLLDKIGNKYGAAGLMGNLYAESALNPKNLQDSYEKSLGYTDDTYTAAVDNGTHANFAYDQAGYGLAQWTYYSRKAALLKHAKSAGKSVGDLKTQLDFLMEELENDYSYVISILKNATSVLQASNVVLMKFEKPADQSITAQSKRASYGQTYYDKYKDMVNGEESEDSDEDENGVCLSAAVTDQWNPKIGEVVKFNGSTQYTASTGGRSRSCKAGEARITNVAKGAAYPYHIVGLLLNSCNAYGWVSACDIEKKE